MSSEYDAAEKAMQQKAAYENAQTFVKGLTPDYRRQLLIYMQDMNCLSCVHFTAAGSMCALAGNTTPPVKVITYGCSKYSVKVPF